MTTLPPHLLTLGDPDLRLAAEAAAAAGTIIRDSYNRPTEIREKGVGDLVSAVDEEADQMITSLIRGNFPNDALISEELQPDAAGASRTWIVDPLDGTAAFLFRAGADIPAVMIALEVDDVLKLGLIHLPLTGDWFYALTGRGAFKNGRPLRAHHAPATLSEAWVEMNHYGDAAYETPAFATLRQRLRSAGGARLVTTPVPHSALAMQLFDGERRLGAVIHDNNPAQLKQGPWDTAAPQAIVEEAGGVFWNLRGERYDRRQPEPILIAANRAVADAIHQQLFASINEHEMPNISKVRGADSDE